MQQLQQEAQRGSSSSINTAGTELAEGGQARQSSAVRAAVKSAAMQVEALQKDLTEHIQFCIDAMKSDRDRLGL